MIGKYLIAFSFLLLSLSGALFCESLLVTMTYDENGLAIKHVELTSAPEPAVFGDGQVILAYKSATGTKTAATAYLPLMRSQGQELKIEPSGEFSVPIPYVRGASELMAYAPNGKLLSSIMLSGISKPGDAIGEAPVGSMAEKLGETSLSAGIEKSTKPKAIAPPSRESSGAAQGAKAAGLCGPTAAIALIAAFAIMRR